MVENPGGKRVSYIFISHASEDKLQRVRPLVEVLLLEGELVWIDRPGAGEFNFGFTQDFISENAIDFLQSGHSWSESIQAALRGSAAVIACVSRNLTPKRDVIMQEIAVAATLGKLVTCIVDDLRHDELGEMSQGLLNLDRAQSPVIDPQKLARALKLVNGRTEAINDLPFELRDEWEKVRNLIASINKFRVQPKSLRRVELLRLAQAVSKLPIGPIVRLDDIPRPILGAFADHVSVPERISATITQANEIVAKSFDMSPNLDRELLPSLSLRMSNLPSLQGANAEYFWAEAMRKAGLKSRKTVGALMINPIADWAMSQARTRELASGFVSRL